MSFYIQHHGSVYNHCNDCKRSNNDVSAEYLLVCNFSQDDLKWERKLIHGWDKGKTDTNHEEKCYFSTDVFELRLASKVWILWIQCSTDVLENSTYRWKSDKYVEDHNQRSVYLEAINISVQVVDDEHKV